MQLIKRKLQSVIEGKLFKGKAILLIGARQVGKSTLFHQIIQEGAEQVLSLNCDEPEVKNMLSEMNTAELRMLIGNHRLVMIDEAQRVPGIGLTLKRITDNFPDVQLLVTGSSSFQLQGELDEPLTGRKYEYHLYPLSTAELMESGGFLSVKQTLEARLIYGSYPDVLNHSDEAKEILMNIAGSYLYKDLLALEGIRKPVLLEKLLVALALQMGSEVSYNEIAQTIGSDSKTVEKYIDLLEKCYIVFRLSAFSRNLRTELKKSKKIYFYDNGIRNAILQNFAPLALRADVGALWENFFISERVKANHYQGRYVKSYFWRTTQQQEIDYIEEEDGAFTAFEMKWNPKKASTVLPSAFVKTYPLKESAIITPDSYWEWLIQV
jgi:predicted AAA+ superfamily ATPase